jgi:hypothetical protein
MSFTVQLTGWRISFGIPGEEWMRYRLFHEPITQTAAEQRVLKDHPTAQIHDRVPLITDARDGRETR